MKATATENYKAAVMAYHAATENYRAAVTAYHAATTLYATAANAYTKQVGVYNEAEKEFLACSTQVSLCNSKVYKSTGIKIHFCKFFNVY